jgi:hypothetical protein
MYTSSSSPAAYWSSVTGNRVPLRLLPVIMLLALQSRGIKVRGVETLTLDLLIPSCTQMYFPFQKRTIVFLVFKPSQSVNDL